MSIFLLMHGTLCGQELTRSSLSGRLAPSPAPTPGAESSNRVIITASAPEVPEYKLPDDQRPKLSHIMKEVEGTQITVTKKATVTKLDQQPTIIDNDQQEAFARTPGVLVTEQQTPAQFNFSYRGLGNPQESEYVLVLQDGIPITTDWIGFPTLYYLPLYQSVSEIQVLRAGNSLLYGPEPAPAINFVSRRPKAGEALTGYSEQVGGGYGLYSTYNMIEGTHGPWEFRVDFGDVRSDNQRDNARSNLLQSDAYLAYRPDDKQITSLTVQGYRVTAGDPGRITYQQFKQDDSFSPTPYNHDWVDRVSTVLLHRHDLGDGWLLEAKAWFTYQDLDSRAAANLSATGAPPTSTTLQEEEFFNVGGDLRLRKNWGRGNAFTVGGVVYHDDAPFRQWTDTNLYADRNDHSGTPRLDQTRNSNYQAIFAENVFRLPWRFHIVPSVRVDHESVDVGETVRPPFLTRPLINVSADRWVPLWAIGIGQDFGKGNETYFNVSTGWRPLRYFDVASPFANLTPGNTADPSHSITYELGVHGTPITGLWYDVSLFWIDFDNRIESITLNNTDVVNQNSGDTRHRGFEGELAYDFLAHQKTTRHLTAFANVQLLDATFTDSSIAGQVGKTPVFAPHTVVKAGLTFRQDKRFNISLTAVSVSSEYWQDSDAGLPTLPAKIPAYYTIDLTGDYQITRHLRLLAGVTNLTNQIYYSRVFQNGIEPAPGIEGYAGLAVGF
ncbi:MAG: TonB-dependent receptor [Rhodospirillales bacterium]|nr:TonB-dependent receptor [Acetobacter sp.]